VGAHTIVSDELCGSAVTAWTRRTASSGARLSRTRPRHEPSGPQAHARAMVVNGVGAGSRSPTAVAPPRSDGSPPAERSLERTSGSAIASGGSVRRIASDAFAEITGGLTRTDGESYRSTGTGRAPVLVDWNVDRDALSPSPRMVHGRRCFFRVRFLNTFFASATRLAGWGRQARHRRSRQSSATARDIPLPSSSRRLRRSGARWISRFAAPCPSAAQKNAAVSARNHQCRQPACRAAHIVCGTPTARALEFVLVVRPMPGRRASSD